MTRLTLIIALPAVVALSACGTSADRCESRVASEYRNVSRLLQEVEANLLRGYTYENQVSTTSLRVCGGYYRPYGGYGFGYDSCYGGPDVIRKRVPIDPAAETRKRDALRSRLETLSQEGTAYCEARYAGNAQTQ